MTPNWAMIGGRLQRIRNLRMWTVDRLAQLIEVRPIKITKTEWGELEDRAIAEKMADALDMPMRDRAAWDSLFEEA